MSERDLDSLYKRASAQDIGRPSAAVRQTILEHARRLADELHRKPAPARWSRWFERWSQLRWQIAVPLAAATLAVILWRPLLHSTLPAPATLQESAPPASAASRATSVPRAPAALNRPQPAPEPFPAAPMRAQNAPVAAPPPAPPPPATSAAESANLARNADTADLRIARGCGTESGASLRHPARRAPRERCGSARGHGANPTAAE